jgi:hypothetical protein
MQRDALLLAEIVRKIELHVAEHGLGRDDLLFPMPDLPGVS